MNKLIKYVVISLLMISSFNCVMATEVNDENEKIKINDSIEYDVIELANIDDFINSFIEDIGEIQNRSTINVTRRVGAHKTNDGTAFISLMTIDGELVYCLEPNVFVNEGGGYESTVDFDKLDRYTREKLWKIAAYGYGHKGDYSDAMFIASQIMIWETVGFNIEPHYTDGTNLGDYWDVSNERATIEWRINYEGKKPSFNNKEQEVEFRVPFTLTDTNGVLGNFDVVDKKGLTAVVNGNDLTITINDLYYDKNLTFETKQYDWKMSQNIIYTKPGSQKVFKASSYDPTKDFKINVKLSTGDLIIDKKDEFGLSAAPGQEFGIWMSEIQKDIDGKPILDDLGNVIPTWIQGEQVQTEAGGNFFTGSDGKLNVFDLLPPGSYLIQELSTTNEYEVSTDVIRITIVKDEVTTQLFENKLRSVNLSVKKVDNDETWRYLNGAEFLVTDITDAGFIENEETISVNYLENGVVFDFSSILNVSGEENVTYHSSNEARATIDEFGIVSSLSDGHVNLSCKVNDEVIKAVDVMVIEAKDDKEDYYTEIIKVDEGLDENQYFPGTDVFKGITGSQYIQVQDKDNHNYPKSNTEVVITEDYERLEEITRIVSDDFGMINLDEFKVGTYYWFVEDGSMIFPIEFEVIQKDDVTGQLEVNGLKWGRKYRACEIGLPEGYDFISKEDKEAGMSCNEFTMDLEVNVDTKVQSNNNELRKLDLKLYKTDPSKNILLNGAWFKVWDIYEDGVNLGDMIDPEYPMPMIKTKEYLGEYVSGALKIDDYSEVLIDIEGEDTTANKESVPNVGIDYMISETEDFSVYEIKTTNVSGQIVAYLPDGKYYSKKVAVEGDDLTEDVFQPKVHYVSKGTIMLPELKYGHPYMICETKAPGGYYIEGDGCEVFTPTAEYGIERIDNYRINEMIKIPVMGDYVLY